MGTVKLPTAVRGANGNGHKSPERPRLSKSPLSQPMRQAPSFADMSSQQRSASMDATVQRVAELTQANNQLYARLVQQEREHDAVLQWVVKLANEHNAECRKLAALKTDYDGHIAWHAKRAAWSSFLAYLRKLSLGR